MSVETLRSDTVELTPSDIRRVEQLSSVVHRALPDGPRFIRAGVPAVDVSCLGTLKTLVSPEAFKEREIYTTAANSVNAVVSCSCGATTCQRYFSSGEL